MDGAGLFVAKLPAELETELVYHDDYPIGRAVRGFKDAATRLGATKRALALLGK